MEKEKILERWSEYISELYHDERGNKPPIMKNFDDPPIMKDEVRKAVKSMQKGKAAGPDTITVEMIESLDEFGIDMLTDFLNAIYDSGEIPSDLSKSIFIALPKKPGATECESHRAISLTSHITKILLKMLMARIRNKISPEIAEEQCGFVKDKGTRNAIYMLRTLTERAIEIQKDLNLCFIDYTKAFDEEIMSILDSLNIDGKDLRIVRNIYWEQTAAMRIGNDLSAFQNIKRGVRPGCLLSPDLFPIYSEIIMRALEGMPGIKVGGYNMNNIIYADDTVLIADNENELQEMLDTVARESEKKCLSLNKKKTEVMVISKKNCTPTCNIVMNGTVLKQVHKFNHLGSLITSDGRCINEIKRRMAQAKTSFQNMKSILTNKRLSLGVRNRVMQCYIEPILLYGCESWSMTKQTLSSIEAMGMWFLRRMLRVGSIVDRKENQFRNCKYSKQYKTAYEQRQEKTNIISTPCGEKGKARAFVDNRKDRRKKKQRSSKNKNARRYSSLAGKKHCGDVCGCKRSRKVEGHDRLRLQQTRQLKKKKNHTRN